MSGTVTKRMLAVYRQMSQPMLFLSGFFQTPARNIYNSQSVEIDIVRSGRAVSIAIQDLSAGYRMNSTDLYTNKEFTPPIHKEAVALNSHDLLKRMPGRNPFEDPAFRTDVIALMLNAMGEVEAKVRRAIELQSSQVLQVGVVDLKDESGTTIYTIDYKPKATHFPTAGTTWGQTSDDPLGDLESLGDVINEDGLTPPTDAIFGQDAWREFRKNADVLALLDNRRVEFGGIAPESRGNGAKFMGTIELGPYLVNMWTYNGLYDDPQTTNTLPFISKEKVVMMADGARLDATFGAIPNIGRELGVNGPNLLPELPGRFSDGAGGMDLHTNVWLSNDGEQLFGGIGARPLMIPTAIDTFGCLDTGL